MNPFDKSKYLERFKKIRKQSIDLCKPLAVEDFVAQPVVDVSPPKWHLGHTSWFFEALILENHVNDYKQFDQCYGYLFNSYYNTVGDRVERPNRGHMTRPTVEEIIKFREYVDKMMIRFVDKKGDSIDENLAYVLELGLQHEQQHQELLITDLKYILGLNPLFPMYREFIEEKENPGESINESYIQMEEGIYEIGYTGNDFCFDNELSRHKVYLHPFQFMDRLVTNEEYLEFIEDGGYSRFNFWLSEGWDWVKKHDIHMPLYWHKIDHKWYQYTLSGLEEIKPNDPVTHVSYFEADAFASWRGKRLLTEAEWEVASQNYEPAPHAESNFVENENFRPLPAEISKLQLMGDVWEWTGSAYLPYPGFKTSDGAIGEYNGKFMVNQMVLKGGSCATSRDHVRNTYRNFFHPHLRWQYTGIRLAESL
jgi:ergothioneine biosynthesis protein EgtB